MFAAWTSSTKPRAPSGIYVLAAHPHWRDSRVNRRLLAARAGVPGVEVNDLYGSYPDFDIDVEAEQAAPRRPSWWCCCTRSSGIRCRR